MKHLPGLFVALLFLLASAEGLLPSAFTTAAYESFEPQLTRRHHLYKNERGAPLPMTEESLTTGGTGLRSLDAAQLAMDFLRNRSCPATSWVVKSLYTTKSNGITHVYLAQLYQGREVANSNANVNIDSRGRVLSAGESCVPGLDQEKTFMEQQPAISPLDALASLSKRLGVTLLPPQSIMAQAPWTLGDERYVIRTDRSSLLEEDVTAELAYLAVSDDRPIPSMTWHMVVRLPNNWFNVHVCAITGEVLSMIDWVKWDSYEVYAIPNLDPILGNRTQVVNPADKEASPNGWLDQKLGQSAQFTTTVGNNAIAQLNPTGSGDYTYNYRPDGSTSRAFNFPIDFAIEPYGFKDASTANLFYWNNIIHDVFYHYGFTEEAGNFQENNWGKEGKGGDAVQANCQDGAGFNNANFATPPDGYRPRMRMYLWDWSSPKKDGDLDSGIIVHEYGHGISIRLTGGPENSDCLPSGQSGGMGEGWGDWWATVFSQKKENKPSDAFPMGSYAAGRGIRPFPYSADFKVNPQTYGTINEAGYNLPSNVHAKGSVWCTILFEVYWSLVTKHGFDRDWYKGTGGNNALFRNVLDGLKLQPCKPSFVDARDAILLADQNNFQGRHVCDMWEGFARRGLGYSAVGVEPVKEAFDLPPACK